MTFRAPAPQPSPQPPKTNWAAISALAACGGVFIAFLTYAIPHAQSPSSPGTQWTYTTTLSQPATTGLESPQQFTPGGLGAPNAAIPSAGPPAACQPIDAAITKYHNTVGSSWYSMQDAASRARDEIEMAIVQSGGGPTPDMNALLNDFQYLYAWASSENSSSYNTVAAQTNTDIRAFNSDCGIG